MQIFRIFFEKHCAPRSDFEDYKQQIIPLFGVQTIRQNSDNPPIKPRWNGTILQIYVRKFVNTGEGTHSNALAARKTFSLIIIIHGYILAVDTTVP